MPDITTIGRITMELVPAAIVSPQNTTGEVEMEMVVTGLADYDVILGHLTNTTALWTVVKRIALPLTNHMGIPTIVSGDLTPLAFQLLENGDPIDLSGSTVELVLSDKDGTAINTVADVAVTVEATGKVTYTPGTALDPEVSPYYARFKITDVADNVSYVPNGLRDTWSVIAE